MEQFPRPRPEDQYEEQARARNANRPLMDKLTGKNKVTGFDLLREDAESANELVDKRREEEERYGLPTTSPQEAADEILAGDEFNRSPENAKFEEMLQAKYPDIALAVRQNMVTHALRMTGEVTDRMGSEEGDRFAEGVHALVRGKVDSMIRTNDMTGMRTLLELNDADHLAAAGIASLLFRMPQELIFSPAYVVTVKNIVHHALERGLRSGTHAEIEEYQQLQDLLRELDAHSSR